MAMRIPETMTVEVYNADYRVLSRISPWHPPDPPRYRRHPRSVVRRSAVLPRQAAGHWLMVC